MPAPPLALWWRAAGSEPPDPLGARSGAWPLQTATTTHGPRILATRRRVLGAGETPASCPLYPALKCSFSWCRFQCKKTLACSHDCEAPCHDNVTIKLEDVPRAAGPWEERGPTTAVRALPCPPCQVPVPITCLGGHETCPWPCSEARPGPCGRKCGRSLPCGNHRCERDCHKVRHAADAEVAGSNCKKCESECLVPRSPACPHPCPLPCHLPPCSPCTTVVKLRCHCGLTNLLRKCGEFQEAEEQEKEALQSCNDQCPKLMECSHR